jgi:hypothetical protein
MFADVSVVTVGEQRVRSQGHQHLELGIVTRVEVNPSAGERTPWWRPPPLPFADAVKRLDVS